MSTTSQDVDRLLARLEAHRKRIGLSQEEMAVRIGVAHSTYSRWLNGHIAPSKLARKVIEGILAEDQATAQQAVDGDGDSEKEGRS